MIEVGEYVRTRYGEIGVITKTYPRLMWRKRINPSLLDFNEIKNHSKELIDLIELGDLVEIETGYHYENGTKVIDTEIYEISATNVKDFKNKKLNEIGIIKDDALIFISINDIKSIVTKEQFKSVGYIVGGKE